MQPIHPSNCLITTGLEYMMSPCFLALSPFRIAFHLHTEIAINQHQEYKKGMLQLFPSLSLLLLC